MRADRSVAIAAQVRVEVELLEAIAHGPCDAAVMAGVTYFGDHLSKALAAYHRHGSNLAELIIDSFVHELSDGGPKDVDLKTIATLVWPHRVG